MTSEILTLGKTQIALRSNGVHTIFSVNQAVWAEPQDNRSYFQQAEELGYGDDTLLMCLEHEVSHTLLSVLAGLSYSPTLFGVATGKFWPDWRDEEAAVLAFQKFCRVTGVSILDLAR